MSQENVEVVRRLTEEFQAGMKRGEFGAWLNSEYIADDVEWVPADIPGTLATYRGRAAFLEFIRTWTEDFETWSVEWDRLIAASDDRVVGLFRQRATGKGSGVPVELQHGLVYELEDGRVIRIRNYGDPAEALKAVGLAE
jgi:ketosteroid isomerase-like protein